MKKLLALSGIMSAGIASVFAQSVTVTVSSGTDTPGQNLINLIKLIQTIIGYAVPILISAAVIAFFYGLVMFIWKGKEGDEAKRKGWVSFMIWSAVAIFVMVAIWGIVAFIGNTLGINAQTTIPTPAIPVTPKTY